MEGQSVESWQLHVEHEARWAGLGHAAGLPLAAGLVLAAGLPLALGLVLAAGLPLGAGLALADGLAAGVARTGVCVTQEAGPGCP